MTSPPAGATSFAPLVRASARPQAAAWLLGAFAAIGLAGSVYAIPIQVSESVELIGRVAPLGSAADAFREGIRSSRSMVRPMRWVQTWWLLGAAHRAGGRYHLLFRGYHALTAALLVFLFVAVARARTWIDVAALAIGLAVLMGLHTFAGLVREAWPVNHFLVIALAALAVFAIAQTRGGVAADAAAAAILAVALLTLESGVLLLPVAIAAYSAGARGISARGLAVMALVAAIYAVARVGYLQIESEGLGGRLTGFGAAILTPDEQIARFGGNPLPLYAYNVAMAGASVLFSQPTAGQWTVLAAWQQGRVPPVFLLQMLSSLATTAVIFWFVLSREGGGRPRRWREPLPLVFITVLVANAALGFSYAKDEIVSVAGVFYALMAYLAVRELLVRPWSAARAAPLAILIVVLGAAWSMRTAGLHYRLRHGAFEARGEWASAVRPAVRPDWPPQPETRQVIERMREEALLRRSVAPNFLPRWHQDWWGED